MRRESDPWRIADVVGTTQVIVAPLTELAGARDEVSAFHPDAVYHLAWSGVAGGARNHAEHLRPNVVGSLDLADLAAGAGCRTFIGVGSQAELGPVTGVIDEATPAKPNTLYGAAKLAAGLLTSQLCQLHGIRHAWLRLLSAYGPADIPGTFIDSLAKSLLEGQELALSHGTQPWDFLYVKDAARALRAVASQPDASGTYVLCSGAPTTIRTAGELLRECLAPTATLRWGCSEAAPNLGLSGSPARLTQDTGWTPETDLAQGIDATASWYRAHDIAAAATARIR